MSLPDQSDDMHMSTQLPALFVSHGSPMFAIEAGATGPRLREWARALPQKPQAVVVVSPHWMTHGVQVMTHPQPQTWHDFGGFPSALYELQYPAPGLPALADRVLALFDAAGITAQPNADQPFDHGAWVPLLHLFPAADVPVVQVSLPVNYSTQSVYDMGRALASLRRANDEGAGVLLIGSGSMTHNLREFFGGQPELHAQAAPYVGEFARWVESRISAAQRDPLMDYRSRAPHAKHAHPSDEHFVPLYFALGAGGWAVDAQPAARTDYLSREVMYSYLAMDALSIQ